MNVPFKARPDGRIHIGAAGEFPCVIAGKKMRQVVTPADLERLVANWKAEGSRDVLLDIDHESLDPAKRTEAAGWLHDIHVDADGLWARPRYTDIGTEATNSGRYRFTSPVWTTAELGGAVLRPEQLRSVALTNRPNIRSLHTVANREVEISEPTNTMNAIAKALGLAEDATEEDILAAIADLKSAKTANEQEVAANRKATAETIAKNRGVTDPAAVTKFVELYVANREAAEGLLAVLPASVPPARKPGITTTTPPAAVPGVATGPEVANREQRREGLVAKIQRERGVAFGTAWDLARAEDPELFKA